jgi:hypothetical protein
MIGVYAIGLVPLFSVLHFSETGLSEPLSTAPRVTRCSFASGAELFSRFA